jgi:hypothetical protein
VKYDANVLFLHGQHGILTVCTVENGLNDVVSLNIGYNYTYRRPIGYVPFACIPKVRCEVIYMLINLIV